MDVLRFKQANCKNCYKCVRFCPVKSIRVYQGHAQIISSDCILCGNCVSVCPQHAKEDISDVGQIRELIASGKQVVVSVDSSYIAYFDTPGFRGIEKPLKALGFTAAHETAEGAYLVKKELEKLAAQPGRCADHHLGCSTIVLYVEKHLPEALPYLAPVLSPMQAHAVLLRERYPGATIVYISPCISKKEETTRFESVGADYDITFTELEEWMNEAGVAVDPNVPADEPMLSRAYTITNGVLHSMALDSGRDYLFLDGLDDSIQTLKSVVNGELRNCFIEIAACHGNWRRRSRVPAEAHKPARVAPPRDPERQRQQELRYSGSGQHAPCAHRQEASDRSAAGIRHQRHPAQDGQIQPRG